MMSGSTSNQKSHYNISELFRCDIITSVIILSIVGFFYTLSCVFIDYNIQDLVLSYNANLFIVGVSNIIGYISLSTHFFK
jgi:hypothetical protein